MFTNGGVCVLSITLFFRAAPARSQRSHSQRLDRGLLPPRNAVRFRLLAVHTAKVLKSKEAVPQYERTPPRSKGTSRTLTNGDPTRSKIPNPFLRSCPALLSIRPLSPVRPARLWTRPRCPNIADQQAVSSAVELQWEDCQEGNATENDARFFRDRRRYSMESDTATITVPTRSAPYDLVFTVMTNNCRVFFSSTAVTRTCVPSRFQFGDGSIRNSSVVYPPRSNPAVRVHAPSALRRMVQKSSSPCRCAR